MSEYRCALLAKALRSAMDMQRSLTQVQDNLNKVQERYAWPIWVMAGGPAKDATASPFIVPGGAMDHTTHTPPLYHYTIHEDGGITSHTETPLRGRPPHPVLPHPMRTVIKKEKHVTSTPTPEQHREAWLALAIQMERQLLATRENAKTSAKMSEALRLDLPEYRAGVTEEDWHATAWAADRLLGFLRNLPAPEVPVDDTKGQASIMDALADGIPRVEAVRLGLAPLSTGGDDPVEHRPRRLLDQDGDLWEELEDGRWGYCPITRDKEASVGPYRDDDFGLRLWEPVHTREDLERIHAPLRDPIGDEYDWGAQ